jgi:uncharacterized protein YkwD
VVQTSILRAALAICASAAALLVPAAGSYAATCPGADATPTAETIPQAADATLCLLNNTRAAAGLTTLTRNAKLDASSLAQSQDMVANKFFAHEGSNGSTLSDRVRSFGFVTPDVWWIAGENIGWGTPDRATPSAMFAAWMASPPHHEAIMNANYREIGVGIVLGTPAPTYTEGATYTTDFGTRTLESGSVVSSLAERLAGGAAPANSQAPVTTTSSTKKASKARRCARVARTRGKKARRALRTCRGSQARKR